MRWAVALVLLWGWASAQEYASGTYDLLGTGNITTSWSVSGSGSNCTYVQNWNSVWPGVSGSEFLGGQGATFPKDWAVALLSPEVTEGKAAVAAWYEESNPGRYVAVVRSYSRKSPTEEVSVGHWVPWRDGTVGFVVDWTEEPPPTPPDPPGTGWDCEYAPDGSWSFCTREGEDGYDGVYSSPCGGSRTSYGMTYEQWLAFADEAAAAVLTPCEGYTPVLPDDPKVECTGVDGIACEATLQDVRFILGRILARMEHEATTPTTEPEIGVDTPVQVTTPNFDRNAPDFSDWTAPEIDDLAIEEEGDRIVEMLDGIREMMQDKFPFGMQQWLPTGLSIGGGGECVEPMMSVLGVEPRGIGWCDSAIESALAGFVRDAWLFLMSIGFAFNVVRMVNEA